APSYFNKYLEDYWLVPKFLRMWSATFRKNRTVFQITETNMLVEAWHHVLKWKFLRGQRNRRLDHLLHVLIFLVVPYYALRERRQALGFEGDDLESKERAEALRRA
ncbi:hypothetical protein FPV67DRAFT_1356857, partial [Lyophyllum atratum]